MKLELRQFLAQTHFNSIFYLLICIVPTQQVLQPVFGNAKWHALKIRPALPTTNFVEIYIFGKPRVWNKIVRACM